MKEGKATKKSYLVEVATVNKAANQESLSYFSSSRLSPGTLVKVPIRSSLTPAVVLRSRDVKNVKSEIRRAGFLLKKIKQTDVYEAGIREETLNAAEDAAKYYAASVGSLLSVFLPKLFLDDPSTFLPISLSGKKRKNSLHYKEIELLQMETEERFGQYRALVRQSFARGSSVLFIVPTHLEAERAREHLAKGINEFVHVFALTGKKSELKKRWSAALAEPHPILFITTPAGIFFSRSDIDTVIVERENSRAYRTLARPFIHFRVFIEIWAKKLQRHLILGDSVLSIETLWRERYGDRGNQTFMGISEESLIRWRLSGISSVLVDSRRAQNENGRFEIITPELKDLISRALSENITTPGEDFAPGRVFLFGARKGLAPTTVCGDCGSVLPCLNCGAPAVLHQQGEASVYVCHACGARRESATTCGYCGSWKLVSLGIGTEQITRVIKDLFPRHHIQILDKDHAPTDKKAVSIVKKFEESGGILVGTELAFFHLESVPYSGLVSADALFSIPDFGINERIFYIVSRLREMTQKETVIQSRNIGKQVLAWASTGNIIDFYQNEIEEREALLYPPFSIFIKIIVNKKDAVREIPKLKVKFAKWQPDSLKDSLIIRLPRDSWPNEELIQELSLLGREFNIKVDPESII